MFIVVINLLKLHSVYDWNRRQLEGTCRQVSGLVPDTNTLKLIVRGVVIPRCCYHWYSQKSLDSRLTYQYSKIVIEGICRQVSGLVPDTNTVKLILVGGGVQVWC